MKVLFACITGAVLLTSCSRSKPNQSFEQAMQVVCDIPSRPSITSLPQDQRATGIAAEMARDVTNPEVKGYFSSVSAVPREQRDRELREMLKRANIKSCWLVDTK